MYRMKKSHLIFVLFLSFALGSSASLLGNEAYIGEPFGVASVTVPASSDDLTRHTIVEKNGRVFYPAFTKGTARRFIGELLGVKGVLPTKESTCLFLFKGTEPLEVTIFTPAPKTVVVTPRVGRRIPASMLWQGWWREFNAVARAQADAGEYPPLTWSYLTTMLSRRLRLEPPLLSRVGDTTEHEVLKTLELMVGAERMKSQVIKEAMTRSAAPAAATFAPPADFVIPPLEVSASDVPIEPIAFRVPHDCFYVRFGSFANLMWTKKIGEEYGKDISRMATLRSQDSKASDKMPNMFGLQQNDLAEMFGGAIIDDVAMIGRDLFLGDGASVGILFKAKSSELLGPDLRKQLTSTAASMKGALVEDLKIGDHTVLHVQSTDGKLRSYYAADGDYHLVSTSRTIVEQFLATGKDGVGSLGASNEFRAARTIMPLKREDTIFSYISSAFLWGLASPQYQIELRRRLESIAEMEMLKLAQLSASSEGFEDLTSENLVRLGFLPPGFGVRPDGSRLLLTEKGPRDSVRGYRGSFTPIADTVLTSVTAVEADRFRRQAEFYARNWLQMDPLMVGLKRYDLRPDEFVERVVIDANVTPFTEEKYGWLSTVIGPPMKNQMTPGPKDIVNLQASIKGGMLDPSVPPHQIYLGVQDTTPATDLRPSGVWQVFKILQQTPGYLGSWPKLGFLDWLPREIFGRPDASGYSSLPFGLWRWQGGGQSVVSFNKTVLAETVPHLKFVETENAAHARLFVGDIANSKLAPWLNDLYFSRAQQAKVGNEKLIQNMTQQFGVPADEAEKSAQELLSAELIDPVKEAGIQGKPTAEFMAPPLLWFRGLSAEFTKMDHRLVLHAELDLQRKPEEKPAFTLPKFPSLNLFGGGKSKPKEPEEEPKPKDPELKPPTNVPGIKEF